MSSSKIIKKITYCVSNLEDKTVTFIDGEKNTIIKTVNISCKPFSISSNNNGDIYVGSYENPITVINNSNKEIRKLNIPNNGDLTVDSINGRIYVSNTSEVLVYDIFTEKEIAKIMGFMVIKSMTLDKQGKQLVVLDSVRKDLTIYDTCNFRLLAKIKNVGAKPSYILISDDNKFVYVANEGIKRDRICTISIVGTEKKEIFQIELPENSSITSLAVKDNILYCANKGLNRIEIINITTNTIEGFITTTLPEPQSLLVTPDKDKLIVTDRNCGGQGALDIIDTISNSIVNTIFIEGNNSQPYDVTLILNEESFENENFTDLTAIEEIKEDIELIPIIAKKIFSSYKETISFSEIIADIPKIYKGPFAFQRITVNKGFIANKTEIKEKADDDKNISKIKFTLRIPYNIEFRDCKRKKRHIKKFLEKNREVLVSIPNSNEVSELEVMVKTNPKIKESPTLIKDVFYFSVDVFTEIKVVGEIETLISSV
ncbi:MAG: YncE family protein [Clostridium argentinense]|uniref:YncE family protein n=1 Tax=Clostridium butanoliproducens TaxID=2991837 RepID=UPI001DA395C8|nr:YncE family protein [Clostridium butanoliproducens]MBS5822758.1 YncE family protein [Clostridium argentinense]MDU1348114.1 YncE family protein [Clostridium argentinense]